MSHEYQQYMLLLGKFSAPNTVYINGRCTLHSQGSVRIVCVASLPMYHWTVGDEIAETYAIVSLLRCGYANQIEVARAFGLSTRSLRRYEHRFETAGSMALRQPNGRPKGICKKPSPWVQTALTLRKHGMTIPMIAHRLRVSVGAVHKWLNRMNQPKPTLDDSSSAPKPKIHSPSDKTDERIETQTENASTDGDTKGFSLDHDPLDRSADRLLARLGLLHDATPVFIPATRIPRAGVLLAIPALVESGIFQVAEEVYGHMGPAFYGLRTTILATLLMALVRIKRPEALKEHMPQEMGRVLGLDRMPEVKTLRRKLARLAATRKAELFGKKLAKKRIEKRGQMLGFLYTDGHVRVYHGKRKIPKGYVTRMRFALPATTDYWVNDQSGDPVFVVTAEMNEGLVAIFPKLLREIRSLIGKRRITIVFDRGGWSQKLFQKILRLGFDLLTYRKGKWKRIPESQFRMCKKTIEDKKIIYELNDRNIRLLKGRLRLRQITRRSENGHQTPIVTSRRDLSAIELAYRMFERWRQENFFKYLREEYALDVLIDYDAEPADPERLIANPEVRKLNKRLTALRGKLRHGRSLYAKAMMDYVEEKSTQSIRGLKKATGQWTREIEDLQKKIRTLKTKRSKLPHRIKVKALSDGPLLRLSQERKHLSNCIKMVAYQAESDLLALLRPHYARADHEGRTLITTAFQSSADLEVSKDTLQVTLTPLSAPHRSEAIQAICKQLNQMKVNFPGTKLCLQYGVAQKAEVT